MQCPIVAMAKTTLLVFNLDPARGMGNLSCLAPLKLVNFYDEPFSPASKQPTSTDLQCRHHGTLLQPPSSNPVQTLFPFSSRFIHGKSLQKLVPAKVQKDLSETGPWTRLRQSTEVANCCTCLLHLLRYRAFEVSSVQGSINAEGVPNSFPDS